MKRTNKGAQPAQTGQPPAEFVEKRSPAKGNPVPSTVTDTQRSEAASSGLDRVREAAKRDKGLCFTNLLHHVSVEELHPGKTRLIEFGRFAASNRKERGEGKPETFDFLGFTHICARKRKDGSFALRRKTIGKRLREKIQKVRTILKRNRHRTVTEQGQWLKRVVQGHLNNYGVPGNRQALEAFRNQIGHAWLHALRRRSQKGRSLTWQRMQIWMEKWIPRARVRHPYPNQRLCV